jgi:integrase
VAGRGRGGTLGGWSEPKWLFPTQQNTPLDYSRRADEYRATLKAAGLTGFTPYSMRHTFAALRLPAGALPMWVSQQLGHRDLTTTLRYYGESIPKRGETWADILERGVLEPTPQVAIPEPETRTKGEAASDWDAELGELPTEKSGAGGGS